MTVLASKPRKKLIEVALPLEAINIASAREKSIRHGHPSTLHLWWARRPLAAARAVIFASLVDDPDSPDALPAFVEACRVLPYVGKNVHTNGDTPRMRLFDFIERLVQWESTTDEAVINTARELIQIATEGNPPPLLDPFAGGGSIPLEAQRLGLEAHASDLNPVAVMINKAQIEIPPRFANQPPANPRDRERMSSDEGWKGAAGLAADVRYYGEWMREKAWERIGHLYPTHNGETVIAWIWARTVKSPNPAVDVHVPLVKNFELSKKKGNEAWIEPMVDPITQQVSYIVHKGIGKVIEGTVNRGTGRCIVTGVPISPDYIKQEARAGRMCAQLMAVVTEGVRNRNYYSPTLELYAEPAKPWQPVVCFDERPCVLHADTRPISPVQPGQAARYDYEYQRNGTCNLFMMFQPGAGWRHAKVTDQRTKADFAVCMRELVDVHFPHAEKIRLVMDNLNTHTPASLYATFPPAEARRLLSKLEFHYTPKHASWLNMVEIELSVLVHQCLKRRIPDMDTLTREVVAWEAVRNAQHATVRWLFEVAQARTKLAHLYPELSS